MGNSAQIVSGHDTAINSPLQSNLKYEEDDRVLQRSQNSCRLLESMILDDDNSCYCPPSVTNYSTSYSASTSPSGCHSRESEALWTNCVVPIYNDKQYLSSLGDTLDRECLEKHLAPLRDLASQSTTDYCNQSLSAKENNISDIVEVREKFRRALEIVSRKYQERNCDLDKSFSKLSDDTDLESPRSVDSFECDDEIPFDRKVHKSITQPLKRKCFAIKETLEEDT